MSQGKTDSDILERILDSQRGVVQRNRELRPIDALRAAPGFSLPRRSLREALLSRTPGIIAECKRRSPSKGVLREPYDVADIARGYVRAGAAAISVLTNEEFFGGRLEDLSIVRGLSPVPVLRKDFIVDAYQLDEARAAGADAVLLIVAALEPAQLQSLHQAATELGLEVLVEVHDGPELAVALEIGAVIIGFNNRNLRTFVTDLGVSERLALGVSGDRLLVAESGLASGADLLRLERAGIRGFLVGEAFMRAAEPGAALMAMLSQRQHLMAEAANRAS